MTVAIAEVAARPYALPFAAPVVTARGRFTHRRGWLLRVTDTDGRVGWGDAAPWPGFGSSDERVSVEIGGLTDGRIDGRRVEGLDAITSDVARLQLAPEAAHALELALLDLLGQREARSIAALFSDDAASTAETHALVLDAPDPTARWLKVKAGSDDVDALEARLAAIIAGALPSAQIRLDVGGGWDVERATRAIPRIARYRVHTLEQPLPAGRLEELAGLRAIANDSGIALAADEDVTDKRALAALLEAQAVDEVVLKPMFVGGLMTARRLARIAAAAGCRATITNALESAVGRAGARHLAAALPGVHGLTDGLAEDVANLPPRSADRAPLPPGHGLGVRPTSGRAVAPSVAIPNPVRSSAMARPAHPALITARGSTSFSELAEGASRRAQLLRARGIRPGMRVGLEGPRDERWVTWLHAVGWAGAVAVPLPDRDGPAERERVRAATAPAIVIDTSAAVSDGPALDEQPWPLDAPRLVVCSSGSSGAPSPSALTTLQLTTSAFGSAIRLGHDPGDRWLCCLPLHHIGGLSILFRCAFYGTTVVLHERFDAERVARALDGGDATLVSLVPGMLARVLDARLSRWGEPRPFPNSLRAILLGGARAPAELLTRCRAIGAPVALTWGMTEAASQAATSLVGDTRLVPHAFSRVASEAGRLVIRGPVAGEAPLVTQDAGTVESDGSVQVHGRADDVIITGGEKVAPAEIEQVLRRHPDIDDAAVVARASDRWGRRPFAAVQTRRELSTEALQAWCRAHLAPFKVPDGFICLAALPRAELGKVALREVRSLIEARFPDRPLTPTKGPQP